MNTHTRSIRIVTLFTALAIVLATCALAATARATDDADEAAIRDNVKQMETGWTQMSGALFATPFAEDADYVVINVSSPNTAGLRGHQQIFDTFMKGTTISLAVERVRFLRTDVAIVHVGGRLLTGQGAGRTEARITLVMSKEKDGWKNVAFQNTEVEKR